MIKKFTCMLLLVCALALPQTISPNSLRERFNETLVQLGITKNHTEDAKKITNLCTRTLNGQNIAADIAQGRTPAVLKKLYQLKAENMAKMTAGIYGADSVKKLVEKTNKDYEALRKVYAESIVDFVTWCYTHSMTERSTKNNEHKIFGFKRGTFKVADVNGKLSEFLNGYRELVSFMVGSDKLGSITSKTAANPYAYYRAQSHKFVDAWGIDLDVPFMDTFKHILIGTDPKTGSVWIKPEEFGLNKSDWYGHAFGYIKSEFRKMFGSNNDGPTANRERVPNEVKETFKKTFVKNKHITALANEGIKSMYEYALTHHNEADQLKLNEFMQLIQQKYPHPELRTGNEIIINKEQLLATARS